MIILAQEIDLYCSNLSHRSYIKQNASEHGLHSLPLIQQFSDPSTGGYMDLLIFQDKYGKCKGVHVFRLNMSGTFLPSLCLDTNQLTWHPVLLLLRGFCYTGSNCRPPCIPVHGTGKLLHNLKFMWENLRKGLLLQSDMNCHYPSTEWIDIEEYIDKTFLLQSDMNCHYPSTEWIDMNCHYPSTEGYRGIYWQNFLTTRNVADLGGSAGCPSDWWPGGCRFVKS